ncbi:MAG TPA: hypothetical protein DDW33_00705 [Ktedonobacter sp.]|jgi:demethylmenaquinone methyltransferase/2-methoxy-6-polyprenyl-1,4-benzoquinol methylase|nr:hypothetical protein [Ktedonobacter sp.]HAG97976.1 hypothetical protein [Ktedonobacter sp.]HAT46373.1 hypothetical protein [Ktedonobacter sp.]HBE24192.1 hypothetical protein [Ktedonobacter sp.]HCF84294.1 hypothetical protein [Ktedonobacter sp.]
MIEAIAPTDSIRRAYDYASSFYGRLIAPLERKPRLRGLALAAIQPSDIVLEVAVGPGATFLEIIKKVNRSNTVHAVDLSPKMVNATRRLIKAAGYSNFDLHVADARQLPFQDETFDVVYNSYMLDLTLLNDIPVVLGEFRRILKPGGRLILVNMSKPHDNSLTWFEQLYSRLPAGWVPYLFGGCRPVLMEIPLKAVGFCNIKREYLRHIMPSEIVLANKC